MSEDTEKGIIKRLDRIARALELIALAQCENELLRAYEDGEIPHERIELARDDIRLRISRILKDDSP